jgi:hypothetical protein
VLVEADLVGSTRTLTERYEMAFILDCTISQILIFYLLHQSTTMHLLNVSNQGTDSGIATV